MLVCAERLAAAESIDSGSRSVDRSVGRSILRIAQSDRVLIGPDNHHPNPTTTNQQVKDWQGNAVPLSKYKDTAKVALVVNVASK